MDGPRGRVEAAGKRGTTEMDFVPGFPEEALHLEGEQHLADLWAGVSNLWESSGINSATILNKRNIVL